MYSPRDAQRVEVEKLKPKKSTPRKLTDSELIATLHSEIVKWCDNEDTYALDAVLRIRYKLAAHIEGKPVLPLDETKI